MGVFLPKNALPGLKKYQYSSVDKSFVSKFILKPFYSRAVYLFPKWMAPNLITLLGLGFSLISVALVVIYNPYLDLDYPPWVYFVFAANMFLYQTLDAIDGLQARRTGSSSPLGELFDHCVDAINTSLGVLVFASVAHFSPGWTIAALFGTTLNFYLSTWEEYYTGTLYLSEFSGPVEGIIIIIGADIATGIYGSGLWDQPLSVLRGLSPNNVIQPFMAIGLLTNAFGAAYNVSKVKHVDLTKAIWGAGPFVGLWVGVLLWINAVPYLIIDHLIALILVLGLIFALLVGRVITAHVTKQKYPGWNVLLFIPFVATFAHYFAVAFDFSSLAIDMACLWISLGLALGVYGMFVTEVVGEITEYLDIGCLYIKYRKSD